MEAIDQETGPVEGQNVRGGGSKYLAPIELALTVSLSRRPFRREASDAC
jgi:hypothetical protein